MGQTTVQKEPLKAEQEGRRCVPVACLRLTLPPLPACPPPPTPQHCIAHNRSEDLRVEAAAAEAEHAAAPKGGGRGRAKKGQAAAVKKEEEEQQQEGSAAGMDVDVGAKAGEALPGSGAAPVR